MDELIKILTVLSKLTLPYKEYSDMGSFITDVDSNCFDVHDAYITGAGHGEINGQAQLAKNLLNTIAEMNTDVQKNTDNHPLPEGLYVTPDYVGCAAISEPH